MEIRMINSRLGVIALACFVFWGCKARGRTPANNGAVDASSPPMASDASTAPSGPAPIAQGARAFVATSGSRFGLLASGSESWTVDTFSSTGEATTLGTQKRFGDHAALAADKDGALVALTLLDQSSGAVYRFAPGGSVTALFEGEPFKAKLTCVVGADDYVFAGAPLVRHHKPSGKTQALGAKDVVQLAAADGTLFVAEQTLTYSRGDETEKAGWKIRATPYAKTSFALVAKGEGIVYGLAASGDGVAWSTIDTPTVAAAETATGSVWFRRGKSGAPIRLAHDLATPMGVALDSTHVYVALRGGRGDGAANGSIVRIPLAGGAPEVIAPDVGAPIVVAVDDTRVYTIADSRLQISAPYYSALTFLATSGDVLVFEKPRAGVDQVK
jgi:hypothetical protein